jgi:hypothetical protein
MSVQTLTRQTKNTNGNCMFSMLVHSHSSRSSMQPLSFLICVPSFVPIRRFLGLLIVTVVTHPDSFCHYAVPPASLDGHCALHLHWSLSLHYKQSTQSFTCSRRHPVDRLPYCSRTTLVTRSSGFDASSTIPPWPRADSNDKTWSADHRVQAPETQGSRKCEACYWA